MQYPQVRDTLLLQTCVNDICYETDDVASVVAVQADLISVIARSGFELWKWSSNTLAVLETVPADHKTLKSLSFTDENGVNNKVLVLHWYPCDDYLSCELDLNETTVFTKCEILSLTVRFFDPLRPLAPSIFLVKHIMQRTWQVSCMWDRLLPPDIRSEWIQFVLELSKLSSVWVLRYCNTALGAPCFLFRFCVPFLSWT